MTDISALRHVIDRLGFGPRPGDLDQLARVGADGWVAAQLHPEHIPLPSALRTRIDGLSNLHLSAFDAFRTYGPQFVKVAQGKADADALKELREKARAVPAEAIEARILRAIDSPRQLEESLVDFWFNHFNVFVGKGLTSIWTASYEEEAIRPHVLGRFRDLLGATARHPAMSFYLDNWLNTDPNSAGARGRFNGLNENYARELMELHTLGVDGGYTQDDVIALARILTGWGFGGRGGGDGADGMAREPLRPMQRVRQAHEMQRNGGFVFAENRHDFSDKKFLGHTIKGGGAREGDEALDILARHPATVRRISFKLAQYYLADAPPDDVVQAMTATFQKTDGDIRAVLKTLFTSSHFRDPANFNTKFKTPYRYVLSAVRASGAPVQNARPLFGTLAQLGQPIYGCQTPDGYKCTQEAWLNADAMTRRITFAVALSGGHLPLDAPPDERGLGAKKPERAAERAMAPVARTMANGTPPMPPVDSKALIATLGGTVSETTSSVLAESRPELQAGLILGSPEFMHC